MQRFGMRTEFQKEAILDELLKTDVYKSISDKRDLIIERIGVYV